MARNFNGTSDHITGSITFNGSGAPQSLSVWFLTTNNSGGGSQGILSSGTNGSFALFLVATSIAQFGKYNVAGEINSSNTYSLTTWNHCAITYDGSNTGVVYLNGTATSSALGAIGVANQADFDIGHASGGTGWFSGSLANFGLWSAALTATEAKALFNGALPYTVRPKSLVSWWPFDGLDSPEPDLSGNKNNGTLTGTTKSFGPPITMFTPRWPLQTAIPPPPATPVYPRFINHTSLIGNVATAAAGIIVANPKMTRRLGLPRRGKK